MSNVSDFDNPLKAKYWDEDEAKEIRGHENKRALRDERRRGEGPPYLRLNRRIFYPKIEFMAWLESLTIQPPRSARPPGRTGDRRRSAPTFTEAHR